jgi:hypothetical protein
MAGIFFVGVLPLIWHRAKDQFALDLSFVFGHVGELPPDYPEFNPGNFFYGDIAIQLLSR